MIIRQYLQHGISATPGANADGTMGMEHEQQDIDWHTLTEEDKDEF